MTGRTEPREAAAALRERLAAGAGVLVQADKDGCRLAAPGTDTVAHVPGFPMDAVDAVDSNGVGDAHVGAFLALLGRGLDPSAAARGANAAAG
ncbi:PfkB family carbohydrate kinase [Streptomyces sp. NPDC086554]|uniref:PfkB family carbohydrate kinase n=1 Tax=Streptomyces sp. NPDC086554 TaxID=3154864 RepID=UPI00341EEC92